MTYTTGGLTYDSIWPRANHKAIQITYSEPWAARYINTYARMIEGKVAVWVEFTQPRPHSQKRRQR